MNLYPLKFRPIFKQTLWGGDKLRRLLHKTLAPENAGESWELSAEQGHISVAKNGTLAGKNLDFLCKYFGADFLGEKVYASTGAKFPLLLKFIDASKDLSLQVYPARNPAQPHSHCGGKTEMWYVVQADGNARLFSGFQEETDKSQYAQLVQSEKIMDRLGAYEAAAGDCFFIPSGRIHAIGAGVLLAEVQQNSGQSYRIYDYHRKDLDGKERPLQVELAAEAIDFAPLEDARTHYVARLNHAVPVVQCPSFTVHVLELQGKMTRRLKDQGSFVAYMCVKGQAELECKQYALPMQMGETVFVPAQCADDIMLRASHARLLEVYI